MQKLGIIPDMIYAKGMCKPHYDNLNFSLFSNGVNFKVIIMKIIMEIASLRTGSGLRNESGLEADWKHGSGLEADWKRTGSGLEAHWNQTGSGLEAN